MLGAFNTARWWAIMAAIGVILAALYLLWAYQRVFHGPAEGENSKFHELRFSEGLVIGPLLVLIIFVGLYPKLLIDRMEPSVKALVAHVEDHAPGFNPKNVEFHLPDAAEGDAGSDDAGANGAGANGSGDTGASHGGED